jgi:hypothetical protein
MRRVAALGLVVVLGALLAACTTTTRGSGSQAPLASLSGAPQPDAPLPQSTVAVTPTQDLWTIPEAQQHFMQIIFQGDADFTYLYALPCTCNGQVQLPDLTGVCQRIVSDNNLDVVDFNQGAWPTVVAPAIKDLSTAIAAENFGYGECANAKSLAAASAGLRDVVHITPQSNAVRQILGLPLVPDPAASN